MKLIITGQLTDLNTYINAERTNKYAAATLKREETERVAWECKRQKLQPCGFITKAVFTWYNASRRKDYDNIEFAQKFLWDGLVVAGILENDSPQYTPPYRTHIHKIDRENSRVELEIT